MARSFWYKSHRYDILCSIDTLCGCHVFFGLSLSSLFSFYELLQLLQELVKMTHEIIQMTIGSTECLKSVKELVATYFSLIEFLKCSKQQPLISDNKGKYKKTLDAMKKHKKKLIKAWKNLCIIVCLWFSLKFLFRIVTRIFSVFPRQETRNANELEKRKRNARWCGREEVGIEYIWKRS